VNNEVVVEEPREMTANEIDRMKWIIAEECSCMIHEVDHKVIELKHELSDIDVTTEGMFDWKDCEARIITGVILNLVLGSDEHLDAINNGLLETYLVLN
jgi:hypothetical protein